MFGMAHNVTDDDPATNLGSSSVHENSVTNAWPTLSVVASQNHEDAPGGDAAWWEPAVAGIRYIHPAEGGHAGDVHRLGWSTGLASAQMRRAPISGRTIRPPQTNVLQVGPVGIDNRRNRLDTQVASQYVAGMPDAQSVARAFVSQSGAAGIRAAFLNQQTGA